MGTLKIKNTVYGATLMTVPGKFTPRAKEINLPIDPQLGRDL